MTFEEFFKKKKIDLDQLRKTDPSLFAEFKNHFEQMGEKSFDHSKKFWFNKLRRSYPLKEQPKVEKEITTKTPIDSKVEKSLVDQEQFADTAKRTPAPAYKPRFTPKNIPVKETEKPENLPNPNDAAKSEKSGNVSSVEEEQQKEAKPVYKPRFNVKNIQNSASEE